MLGLVDAFGVLGRDQHLLDRDRTAVRVAHRDLGLAVGAQVVERAVLADQGQPLGEPVGDLDRHRHQRLGLRGRVAEHHSLVAGTFAVESVVGVPDPGLDALVDALGDVGRLLVEGDQHGDRVAVVSDLAVVVTDLADRLADQFGHVDLGVGRELAGDHRHAGVDQGLAGDPRVRILLETGVEDGVRDLVGDLVRMAFGDRFGGEQVLAFGELQGLVRLVGHSRQPIDLLRRTALFAARNR